MNGFCDCEHPEHLSEYKEDRGIHSYGPVETVSMHFVFTDKDLLDVCNECLVSGHVKPATRN